MLALKKKKRLPVFMIETMKRKSARENLKGNEFAQTKLRRNLIKSVDTLTHVTVLIIEQQVEVLS